MPTEPPTSVTLATLRGDAIATVIGELARLRTEVFREWPYLYDGDLASEQRYIGSYAMTPKAVVVVARATTPTGSRIVGASTALPATDSKLRLALASAGIDADSTCYFGESVLLRPWRGQGVGVRFFHERELAARAMGARHACFAAVLRDPADPRRPPDYQPLDRFWTRRGYARLPGQRIEISWKEPGSPSDLPHGLELWAKHLEP